MMSFDELSPERRAEVLLGVEDPSKVDDPDNPAWTEEDFRRSFYFDKPLKITDITDEMYDRIRDRGRPRSPAAKVATKLRLDPDVLAAFKAEGPGWQTRMNAALRAAMPGGALRSA